MEARKTEIAMGDCTKSCLQSVGVEWKNNREKQLETADRERSKKKLKGRKKDNGEEFVDLLS